MVFWEEESYTRRDENGNLVTLEEYEATHRPTGMAKVMTKADIKLYLICGVGFFIDAYDLFIINLVNPIWTYEYWQDEMYPSDQSYPFLLKGAVNAAANIGNIIGQVGFGFMGDSFGRKFVYGKEMIVAIIGIILTISVPNYLTPTYNIFWWFFGFRLLMGIGIGGDYPMSAAIVAERSTLANRGRMLGFIFANQGWGTFGASVVTLILLGIFKSALTGGDKNDVNAIWRLQIGLALVPAFITLYWRLTMPEGRKFQQSTELSHVQASSLMNSQSTLDSVEVEKAAATALGKEKDLTDADRRASVVEAYAAPPSNATKFRTAFRYFSEWRHLKKLIGTASTWFLVDIAFYGTNLNQSVILGDIGFAAGADAYDYFVRNAYGNLIIVAAGYLPGYYITVATIELLGRRWIQIQGFLVTALMFGILAGKLYDFNPASDLVLLAFAQLFFNFGANATTFIVPGEAFPSRVRGFAHGVSAAVGKLGAILAGVLFNYLANDEDAPAYIGIQNVLWIFFAVSILGAIMTYFFVPETKGIDADDVDFQECQAAIQRV